MEIGLDRRKLFFLSFFWGLNRHPSGGTDVGVGGFGPDSEDVQESTYLDQMLWLFNACRTRSSMLPQMHNVQSSTGNPVEQSAVSVVRSAANAAKAVTTQSAGCHVIQTFKPHTLVFATSSTIFCNPDLVIWASLRQWDLIIQQSLSQMRELSNF